MSWARFYRMPSKSTTQAASVFETDGVEAFPPRSSKAPVVCGSAAMLATHNGKSEARWLSDLTSAASVSATNQSFALEHRKQFPHFLFNVTRGNRELFAQLRHDAAPIQSLLQQ